jgi:activator of HSP90 ATPase
MPKRIMQTVTFHAAPREVYDLLMDTRKHAKFTGAKASISRKVGGKCTAYDGYVEAINLVVVPGKEIVQSWHASDWPGGHYARTTFRFTRTKKGTTLTFRQANVPDDQYESIKKGWIDFYWTPMKKMLERSRKQIVRHGSK